MRGYLPPVVTGYIAAGIGLLAGAQLTMQVAAGHVLALATVAGLLAAGVLLRQAWLVALGAFGRLAGDTADHDPVPAHVGRGAAGDPRGGRGPDRFRGLAGEAPGRVPVSARVEFRRWYPGSLQGGSTRRR